MNSDILISLSSLFKNISGGSEEQNIEECHRLLVQLNKHLSGNQINPADLNSFTLYVFNKEYGILKYISIVHPKPAYKEPLVQAVEIIHLLVNNFPKQIEKYVPDIIQQVCLKILQAFSASARAKVKAINIFMKVLERITPQAEHVKSCEELYNVLCQCLDFQYPETVKEKIFECLGLYVKHSGHSLNADDVKKLKDLFISQIALNSTSSKEVKGLFLGLASITERAPIENGDISRLYDVIKQSTLAATKNRSKTSCRSALLFFHKNVKVFSEKIFEDHKFWHENLFQWLTKLGSEENKLAFQVILAVYKCITDCLMEKGKEQTNQKILKVNRYKQNVKHYMKYFKIQKESYLATFRYGINTDHDYGFQKRTCIQGIRIMFKAAPAILEPIDTSNFSTKLIDFYRLKFVINRDMDSDDWLLLPDYIEMITSVITSTKIEGTFANLIKNSLIVIVETYPQTSNLKKWDACSAFLFGLYSMKASDIAEQFFRDLIQHCVIWSCSHHHIAELDYKKQTMLTVRNFFNFWKTVLLPSYKTSKIFEEELMKQVNLIITQELIHTLFVSINKLNLPTSTSMTGNNNELREALTEKNKLNDFAIFLNLVDFYVEIIPNMNPQSLNCHLNDLFKFLIDKSTEFPMISGFHKVLNVCFSVANKFEYFNNTNQDTDDQIPMYLLQTLNNLKKFEGELLISTLKMLMECPRKFVENTPLQSFVPCFTTVFTIGINYLPLADLGITTLEKWQTNLPRESMENFLKQIVPLLDIYLRSKSLVYSSDNEKRNKYKADINKRKIIIEIEPELVKLQRKILKFVGRQSLNVCKTIVEKHSKTSDVWGSMKHLTIALKCEDLDFEMCFDQIVPKIVDLSLHCSDRKMRITSCELLQSLVVLFLGKSKQMTDADQQDSGNLMKYFSHSVLELGCDPDQIVLQIFELLFVQMIHWYSNPSQWRKPHTSILIETLLDGACSSTNSDLRIRSGKYIGEYVKWAIKQTSETRLVEDFFIIKILVKKIRFLSSHPDHFKRSAAALIFNNIYSIIREEEQILSIFWIEIFQIFINSLNSSSEDEDSSSVYDSLKHLQRGFVEKCNIFNESGEKRRKPYGFNGTKLLNVLEFLLETISISPNVKCREKCMELFKNIIPYTLEVNNPKKYFETYVGDPYKNYLSKLEKNSKEFKPEELERCLDGFIFLMKNDVLTNSDLRNTRTNSSIGLCLMKSSIQKNLKIKITTFASLSLMKNCRISVWNEHFWKIVLQLLEQCFYEILKIFFEHIKKLPHREMTEFVNLLKTQIMNNFNVNLSCGKTSKSYIKHLLFLQNSSLNETLKFHILYEKLTENLLMKFLEIGHFNSYEIEFYSSILEFSLNLQNQFKEFVEFLYSDEKYDNQPIGMHILKIFEKTCIPIIIKKFDEFLNVMVGNKTQFVHKSKSINIIKKILTFMIDSKRNLQTKKCEDVLNKLCDKWYFFDTYFRSCDANLRDALEIIRLMKIMKSSQHFMDDWLISVVSKLNFNVDYLDSTLEILEVFFETYEPTHHANTLKIKSNWAQLLKSIQEITDNNKKIVNIMKIGRLFSIFPKSKTHILLDFIIKSHSTFEETESYINSSVFKNYVLNMSHDEQRETVKILHEHLMIEDNVENLRKYRLAKNISFVIFQHVSLNVFENFLITNLKSIHDMFENNISTNSLAKIWSFMLIELMFARLKIGENNEIDSELTGAVYGNNPQKNGKDLLRFFLKHSLNSFRELHGSSNSEISRLYKCHSYNSLVSIATNCLNDPKFHVKLFTRLENDEDILWRGLVDLNRIYKFEKNFNVLPSKKAEIVNIRTRTKQQNKLRSSTDSIRSQRIFNSSLSEDVTRYDMTNVTIRNEAKAAENIVDLTEVFLDSVDVNDHECMATFCGLITYLGHIHDSTEDIPECFKRLRAILLKETTPVNVRIFLVKAIENCWKVFANYSQWFLAPILKFLVDKCAGNEINFFVTDLLVMLANWSEKSLPQNEDEQSLFTNLMEFLFDQISCERKDMFKYNLLLIKSLLEVWKKNVRIPEKFLERLINNEKQEKEIEVHLSSTLIINDIFVFENGHKIVFLNFLLSQLNCSKKSVYSSASETLGLLLKKWNEKFVTTTYYDDVECVLNNIWETEQEKFGIILEGITNHFPNFINSNHVNKLLSRLGAIPISFQIIFLRVILRSVHAIDNFNELELKDWAKYMNNESVEIQVLTLSLIKETLPVLEKNMETFTEVMKKVCEKVITQNDLCLKLVYEISMRVCEIYWNTQEYSEVFNICKECLVNGITSSNSLNPELLNSIRNFWKSSQIFSNSLVERYIQTLSMFHKPNNEDGLINSSVYFLMNLIETFNSERPIFEYALEDCNFEEYELMDTSTQDPYSVPMFAETFIESSNKKIVKKYFVNELRATQSNFIFSPTLKDEELIPYISSQSSLMFDVPTSSNSDDEMFKNPNKMPELQTKVFKRRFLKNSTKIAYNFANLEVKGNIQRDEQRKIKAKERDKEVFITRKYRRGDFPDIQIPISAIILPLQLLAAENSDVSRLAFEELFQSIHKKFDENHWNRLNEILKLILTNSFQFNTNLMRTILDLITYSEYKIVLEPGLISECCLASGLVSNGTLVLEDYLRNLDFSEETSAKRLRGATDFSSTSEDLHWIKLAELYKEMHELDVVRSIFQEKFPMNDCNEIVKEAIKFESENNWMQAQNRYGKLLKIENIEYNKIFYCDAYFRCFANLGQWEELENAARSFETQNWNDFWDEDWKQKILLPWLIESEINVMLFKERPSKIFFEHVNKSLCETSKAEYLKMNFPQHLSIMWILNEDLDISESFLSKCIENILSQWQIIDPMFQLIRYEKISKLRSYTTMFEFIEIFRKINCVEIEEVFKNLRILWNDTQSSSYNSIVEHEKRVLYQKQFISLLRGKVFSQTHKDELDEIKFKLETGLIEAALCKNNFYMARKYCLPYKNKKEMSPFMAKMMFIKSKSLKDQKESIRMALKSLEIISNNIDRESNNKEFLLANYLTSFEISEELSNVLQNNTQLLEHFKENIGKLIGTSTIENCDVLPESCIQKIVDILENCDSELRNENISNAYFKLAYFLNEKNDAANVNNFSKYVLRSMKKGSKDAKQLFPCILQRNHLDFSRFHEECSSVPTWMLLGWIPQIFANLNIENVEFFGQILIRIAETYPQAIMYSYRLSRANFVLGNQHFNNLIQKLDSLLQNEGFENYLKALSNVNVPDSFLEYHILRMKKFVTRNEFVDFNNIEDYVKLSDLLSQEFDSNDPSNFYGNIYKRLRNFRREFDELKSCRDKTELLAKIETLQNTLRQNNYTRTIHNLKDFSPWLSHFSMDKLDIEIPGQYDGQKMPILEYHTKVYKFKPEVTVMISLRKPIKITIIGNDTKDYPYLIKSGEDLRQDQRVQQLFDLMNEMFRKNENRLSTFKVIPLTSSLGMIKWIENTLKLNEFMKKGVKDKRAARNFPDGPLREFETFVQCATGKLIQDKLIAYGEFMLKYDRNKVQSKYRSFVNQIDPNALRKAFWNISANIESFIALRHNFMKSYATLCTAHWLLGIGDRHLRNTLISLDDGKVIGIDFGHAFGSATQNLSVPELIPFRLTPQIVNFMEPFKEKGHFRESMLRAMKSLRQSKRLLLATANVFVREPSLDWLESSKNNSDNFDNSHNWYPQHKIQQFRRKLEGVNSTVIMIEDLRAGVTGKYIEIYCKLVDGLPEFDYRARVAKNCLTVEEQVDCLIDHAGDYNLLGRTYSGWRPWV